jgi:GMP synthase-like glutamine amidotransferase
MGAANATVANRSPNTIYRIRLTSGTPDMIKRALVFQHMDDEPPGLFGEFLDNAGASMDIVMLHRGEAIPSLKLYDFLLVMGGAMDVWETDAHPWLVPEKQAIKEWVVGRNRPFLGICLGLQLLAEALGGKVGLAHEAEVGVGKIELNGLGLQHPMTEGLNRTLSVMQWHHAEVTDVPSGAEVLASSATTNVQIMSIGRDTLATQFHAELTPGLITRWAHIPQYLQWLEEAHGPGAYERICLQAMPQMAQMRTMSRTLFDNLISRRSVRAAA